MILILLSLYHVYYSSGFANAYPTHTLGATATSYARDETVYNTNYRSTFDIIQSCLATIFACTWVAMHPDVPDDRSTWWKRNDEQITLFLMALLVPEIVILEAIRNWHRAQLAMRKMPSFTLAQCHFLTMRGVVFRTHKDELQEFRVGLTDDVKALKKHSIDLDSEISARSKSSPVAKALVVIQVSWFVLQCIARGAQRLVITELETMALAYGVLNGIMYALWWQKPAGIEVPLIIDISKDQLEDGRLTEDHDSSTTATTTLLGPSEEKSLKGGSANRVIDFLMDLSKTRWEIFELLIIAFVGSIFGGLHCIAFSFEFPSPKAYLLWKPSALCDHISSPLRVFVFVVSDNHTRPELVSICCLSRFGR